MDKTEIAAIAGQFVTDSPDNFVGREIAVSEEVVGMRIFEPPIFSYGSAEDQQFEELKYQPSANLKYFVTPLEWLPNAKTVISFFLPYSKEVRDSNKTGRLPSGGWLHGRVEGQFLNNKLCIYLREQLSRAGYESIIPSLDPGFKQVKSAGSSPAFPDATYTSNWSERHVAYICGHGTFGLSKGLITRKGTAGRFGSLVTTLSLEPDKRNYKGLYDYCHMCGKCAKKCPAEAISLEKGKNHDLCLSFLDFTRKEFSPRYGCGKCQVGLPCEDRIPVKN